MPKNNNIETNQINDKLPLAGNLYKKNKRRISFSKLFKMSFITLSFVSIIFIVVYAFFLESRTSAESINQETVLLQISKNFILPETDVVNMMRVTDAKSLSTQDEFYKNVKDGDYIIAYKNLIIVYDFNKALIKNVKTY